MLTALFKDIHQHLRIESLLMTQSDRIPNDIAALSGARILTTSEIPEGKRLNESLIKDLTGGDQMTARFLHGEFFTFYPKFKLWMFGNHQPIIVGQDDGIWRRIMLIPFEVMIAPDKRRPRHELEADLRSEASGILTWAVQGFQQWQMTGLKPPERVIKSTQQYRDDMDTIGEYFDSCCVFTPHARTVIATLYNDYCVWCAETHGNPYGKQKFIAKVQEKYALRKDRGTNNKPTFFGIGLLEERYRVKDSIEVQDGDSHFDVNQLWAEEGIQIRFACDDDSCWHRTHSGISFPEYVFVCLAYATHCFHHRRNLGEQKLHKTMPNLIFQSYFFCEK